MPYTMKAVETYINGKKYKYACANQLTLTEKELCLQYLIEKKSGQLFCKLTKRYLNNRPHQIRQHLNGRRFKKALNNKMDAASSKPRKEDSEQNKATENGQGTEMWVPPDSESENEEITELDPEFKEEKSPEENSYSFGELNIGKTSSNEGNKRKETSKNLDVIKSKTNLKRPANESSEKSIKKRKKSKTNSHGRERKKRKVHS